MNAKDISFSGGDGNRLEGSLFAGDSGSRVALLLHGGGQTRHSWQGTASRLADRGLTAITVDARGHGTSDWIEDKAYTFHHYARDVVAVSRAITDQYGSRPICIGASLGGISAMMAQSLSKQDLLDSLVLVDITPRMDLNGVAKIQGFMSAKMHDGFDTVQDAADAIAAYLPHRKKPKSLDGLRKNLRQMADGRWRWHWDPAFIEGAMSINTVDDRFQQNLLDAAAQLRIPTLLVRGARSELVSEEHAREFLDLAPHAQYVDVSDAGHMVAGDKNDVFSDAVLGFLDDIVTLRPKAASA